MKFKHIADVHLGAEPDSGSAYSPNRGAEIWNSFAHIIDLCEQDKTDLLLIAGDLFHRQPLSRELKEVDFLFSGLTHTQVVLIAGNHDYIKKNSYYLTYPWKEQVHFLKSPKLSKAEFPEFETAVYGLSYHGKEIQDALYDDAFPDNDYPCQILLAHGGDVNHIPFKKNKLTGLGYSYVALGHIHKPQQIVPGKMVYAGALEPIDKNDTGVHGFIEGSITGEGCSIKFVPSAAREYLETEVPIEQDTTGFSLRKKIKGMIEESGINNMYKITLSGIRDPDITFDLANVDSYGNIIEIEDRTFPAYDFKTLMERNKDNLLGKYIESFYGCFGSAGSPGSFEDCPEYQALCEGVQALMETKRGLA